MRYSSAIGIDVFVRGDLEDAVGGGVDDRMAGAHVLGAELVDDHRAGRRVVADRRRGRSAPRTPQSRPLGSRQGTSGKRGRGRCPASSQCPVTESFPGERSAMRPNAPSGVSTGAIPCTRATRGRPSERSAGSCSGTRREMLPSVSLPRSPYASASGSSPTPTLSSTVRKTRSGVTIEVESGPRVLRVLQVQWLTQFETSRTLRTVRIFRTFRT